MRNLCYIRRKQRWIILERKKEGIYKFMELNGAAVSGALLYLPMVEKDVCRP